MQFLNEGSINENMMANVLSKNHVIGCDTPISSYVKPVNFSNSKLHTGINPNIQNNEADQYSIENMKIFKEQVGVCGSINLKFNDLFYKGKNVLIKGEFPEKNKLGILINEVLANENNMEIGDKLKLENEEKHITKEFIITGIYKTNLRFEVIDTNFAGDSIYRASPYNILYTDYDSANALMGNGYSVDGLTIYIDSPNNIQQVIDDISHDKVWEYYDVLNLTGARYNEFAGQLKSTVMLSQYIVIFSLAFGVVILIIAMTFLGSDYIYETGLYMVLGVKKLRILLIRLLQGFIIVFAALLATMAISQLMIMIINNVYKIDYISSNSINAVSCYITGENDIVQNFHVALTADVFIGMAISLFIITITSIVLPLIIIIRLKPREVVAGNKKG